MQGSATGRRLLSRLDVLLRQQNLLLQIEQVPQSREVQGFHVWGLGGNPWFRLHCANPLAPIVAPWHPPGLTRAIYFAHELIHVSHNLLHRDNPNEGAEEWATIGLGKYAGNDFTENLIRCEKGLLLRTSHADLTAGNSSQDEINRFHRQGYADPVCHNDRYEHPLVIQPRPGTGAMTVPQDMRR